MTLESDNLACRELVELLTTYFEGALDPAEHERVETHLLRCRGCAAYLAQMRATLRAVGRLSEHDVPAEARAALLAAFRSWRSGT